MTADEQRLKPATRWSDYGRDTWGPYWDAMFQPRMVTPWINWKLGSTGVNIARRFWYQREYRRWAYESVYGSDPANWPSQHPGIVLATRNGGHPACLRCHYFDPADSGPLVAFDLARRHESSGGKFRGRGYQHPAPGPERVQTPKQPRRTPIPPLHIADRYVGGRRRRADHHDDTQRIGEE